MKLKSIIYDMRQQPVITAVSTIGTALAIFLIMVIVMMQQVNETDIAPEVNRHRTLYANYLSMSNDETDSQCSGSMTINAIHELYDSMESVESIGIYCMYDQAEVSVPGRPPRMSINKATNAGYFDINKYDFIQGAPFTETDVESGQKVAVINESVARSLFDHTDVVGQEILIDRCSYRIVGVIKDVNPITSIAYSEIFFPIQSRASELEEIGEGSNIATQYLGDYSALILVKDAEDIPSVKAATANRYASLNNKLADYGWKIDYFGNPFTIRESAVEKYSNVAPDIEGDRKMRIGLFAILLLVPAINLSSITQNRLRQRVSEIGLKRAFGCTRARVMREMFVENLVLTTIGAIIGLALSIIAAWLWADFMFGEKYMYGEVVYNGSIAFNPISMLSLATFAKAIFFCLALNILSCGIPTIMASCVNPANAINGHVR